MNKELEKHFNKRQKDNPGEPRYISLCYILEGSGEDSATIYEIFDEYIPKGDFLPSEREQMVQYLITISEDLQ